MAEDRRLLAVDEVGTASKMVKIIERGSPARCRSQPFRQGRAVHRTATAVLSWCKHSANIEFVNLVLSLVAAMLKQAFSQAFRKATIRYRQERQPPNGSSGNGQGQFPPLGVPPAPKPS